MRQLEWQIVWLEYMSFEHGHHRDIFILHVDNIIYSHDDI